MTSEPGLLSRTELVRHAYVDSRGLAARQSIYVYRRPRVDLVAEALALIPAGIGPVLDVGAGNGAYARAARERWPDRPVVALDLSPGMVAEAGAPGLVADAEGLPVGTASVEVALAMHMLYHVPRPEAAVAELARVVRPGGLVLLSANAPGDKAALYGLRDAAESEVTGRRPVWRSDQVDARCSLDRAEELARRHFATVRRVDFTGTVEVPEPAPVIAFCESLRGWYPGERFDEIMSVLDRRVTAEIARTGAFRFAVHTGILACG